MTIERYEVLSGELRRRHWPRELKEEIVLETLAGAVTETEVARRRGIDRSLLYRWRREMKVGPATATAGFVPVHLVEAMPAAGAPDADCRADTASDERRHWKASAPTGRMEITLKRGRRISVFADVDGAALSRVLEVLEGR